MFIQRPLLLPTSRSTLDQPTACPFLGALSVSDLFLFTILCCYCYCLLVSGIVCCTAHTYQEPLKRRYHPPQRQQVLPQAVFFLLLFCRLSELSHSFIHHIFLPCHDPLELFHSHSHSHCHSLIFPGRIQVAPRPHSIPIYFSLPASQII